MQGQKQGTKDLPRIRISSRLSKAWIQGQKIRQKATRYLPAFNVRYSAHRTMTQRQNRAALIIALILHLIAAFFLIKSIRQDIVAEDVIYVEWVELPPPARTLVKPRPVEKAAKAPRDIGKAPTQAKVVVPMLSATNTQEPPPLETDVLESVVGVSELETRQRGDAKTLLPHSSTERGLDRGSYARSGSGRVAIDPTIGSTVREEKGAASSGSDLALAPDKALDLSDENLVP